MTESKHISKVQAEKWATSLPALLELSQGEPPTLLERGATSAIYSLTHANLVLTADILKWGVFSQHALIHSPLVILPNLFLQVFGKERRMVKWDGYAFLTEKLSPKAEDRGYDLAGKTLVMCRGHAMRFWRHESRGEEEQVEGSKKMWEAILDDTLDIDDSMAHLAAHVLESGALSLPPDFTLKNVAYFEQDLPVYTGVVRSKVAHALSLKVDLQPRFSSDFGSIVPDDIEQWLVEKQE